MVAKKARGDAKYGTGLRIPATKTMSSVTGVELVVQDSIQRLRGRHWYDPEYGYPIIEELNADVDDVRGMATNIERELLEDDRISKCDALVAFDKRTGELDISIRCTLSGGETFELIANVADIRTSDIVFVTAIKNI